MSGLCGLGLLRAIRDGVEGRADGEGSFLSAGVDVEHDAALGRCRVLTKCAMRYEMLPRLAGKARFMLMTPSSGEVRELATQALSLS